MDGSTWAAWLQAADSDHGWFGCRHDLQRVAGPADGLQGGSLPPRGFLSPLGFE